MHKCGKGNEEDNMIDEQHFMTALQVLIQEGMKDSRVELDLLNNRIMVSFINSDDGFDIKVEKE